MDDKTLGMSNCGVPKDAVCIRTEQVYDSCKSKECLENVRVFLTERGQNIVDRAINVKCRNAEIIWIFSDVEPVPFNQGFYTVDLKYFFKITLDVFTGVCNPTRVAGLATFDKKVVLFGSEGNAKVFASKFKEDSFDPQLWKKTNLPKSVVEVVDPICLSAKVVDTHDPCGCNCGCDCDTDFANVPECVQRLYDDALVMGGDCKRVYVTLGLFTIIKLTRDTQLLIPAYDFCIPDKECISATDDNPCDLFEKLNFPIDEFFPPLKCNFGDQKYKYEDLKGSCGCN